MRWVLVIALFATVFLAQAQPQWQPIDAIRAAALSAVPAHTAARARVDEHVRLPVCPVPLQAYAKNPLSVEVSCPQPGGWRLFVPVIIRYEQDVLVLTRHINAGHVLHPADLRLMQRNSTHIATTALNKPEQAIGKVLRRTLAAGTVLSANDLITPRLIQRGDVVNVITGSARVQVRVAGKALHHGGVGDRISVENLSSHKIVHGVINEAGEVEVRP